MREWLGPEDDELHHAFRKVFGSSGSDFGSQSIGLGGLSDGNRGVQWNAWIEPGSGERWAGVNLEGMKYDRYPVARLIQGELKSPTLPSLAESIEGADRIMLLWARDFWRAGSRPKIVERDIHPTPIRLNLLGKEEWRRALEEALACLDETRNYQGWATQQVTEISRKGEQTRTGKVAPHLKFKVEKQRDHSWESFLQETKLRMQPLYDWVAERTTPAP